MRIQTNVESLNAYRNLNNTNRSMSQSMERLSSGFRINRAADDAAGLAISEKMRGQVRGLDQSVRNAQDATSMIQTAEGALNESHEILQRMRELSVQASNDTLTEDDRVEIQEEIDQLTSELDRIAETTEFNTQELLDGSLAIEEDFEEVVSAVTGISSSYVEGITNNTDATFVDGDGDANRITIDDAGDFYAAAGSNSTAEATIEIQHDGEGNLLVDLESVTDGGTTQFTASDIIEADEDGNFSYDNHGVEFTLSAEEFAQLEEDVNANTTAIKVDATDQDVGTDSYVSLESDWSADAAVTTNGTDMAEVTSLAIDPDSAKFMEGAAEVEIEVVSTTQVDVKILDADGATLSNDTFEDGNIPASYDNHGVSFDFAINDAEAGTYSYEFATEEVQVDDIDNSSVFHIGANEGQNISVAMGDMSSEALGVGDVDVTDQASADEAITTINEAIESVSSQRSELGAVQNRLDHTVANLEVASENLQAAESRIRDVDMAHEMTEFSKQQILEQAGTAMLAQANQAPQSVLQLLG